MNPRILRGTSPRWVTWIIPTLLLLFLLVPCFFKGTVTLAGVSRVTAYHDPFWNTRTKRTTAVRPAFISPKYDVTTPATALPEEQEEDEEYYKRTTPGFWLSSPIFHSDPSVNKESHLPPFMVAPIYPQGFPNNNWSINSPLQNNTLRRRRKLKGVHNEVTNTSNITDNIPNVNREPKLYPNSIPVNSPYFLEAQVDPYPRRKYRRRRLTRRKKLRERYFQPQQPPAYLPNGESEGNEGHFVSSIEPLGGLPSFGYESFDNNKFWPSPAPGQYSDDFLPVEFKDAGNRPDGPHHLGGEADEDDEGGEKESVSPHKPKSNSNNIVIYQRGETMKVNPRLPITTRRTTNGPASMLKSVKYRRVKPVVVVAKQDEEGEAEEEEEEEADLHLSESFNPFLNASVPISTDLKHSLQHQYNYDLLHPLLSTDTILKDVPKVPENKTIAIRHKLSDSPVGVKIAPDLHHELTKNPFMNHDGIIGTDYDRQLQKTPPRISVKHSVSMSTSSSMSFSTSSSAGRRKEKNGPQSLPPTTPMPSISRGKSPQLWSLSPSSTPSEISSPSQGTTTSTRRPPTILRPRDPPISPTSTTPSLLEIIELAFSPSTPKPHLFNFQTIPRDTDRLPQNPQLTTQRPSDGTTTSTSTKAPTIPFLKPSTEEGMMVVTTYKPSLSTMIFRAVTSPSISSGESGEKSSSPSSNDGNTKPTTAYPSILRQNTRAPFTLRPRPIQIHRPMTTTTTTTRRPDVTTQKSGATTRSSDITTEKSGITTQKSETTTRSPGTTTRRPMGITRRPGTTTRRPGRTSRRPATITQPPPAASHTFINTFLDNIDELSGKNSWIPTTILPSLHEETPPPPTISGTTTPPSRGKQKGKVEISRDPPLILMPPFTNEKEVHPITLTTPNPSILATPVINETLLLQQLLGILNEDLGITTAVTTTTPKPTTTATTTTTRRPTTRKKSTRRPSTTPRPLTTEQANLFNLFNLFTSTTTPAPAVGKPTTQNDFFGLLNLFQPTTRKPSQQNDLFGLLNLFQQPAAPTPAPPGQSDLLNILNLFTQTPRAAPIPTTTRRPITTTKPPQSPGGDLLSLLNFLQQPTNQQSSPNAANNPGKGQGTKNPQSDADALLQQALLESLGLKPGGLFSPQASNVKHQLATPSSGLSDSDLTSIYALIEQQQAGASSTTESSTHKTSEVVHERKNDSSKVEGKVPSGKGLDSVIESTTTAKPPTTTTLMPIFKNMLNLFGIADPAKSAPSPNPGKANVGPVYNPKATSPKPKSISHEDLILELLTAEANKSANKDLGVLTPSKGITPAPAATSTASSLDILSQLLGQAGQSAKVTPSKAPKVQQQPAQSESALDLQALLAQSWLLNNAGSPGGTVAPRPEVTPSESNIFHVLANQFTPQPQQKPNGLYYWVDLNAFMGDNPTNPTSGIRPKLGFKDYFVKVKRETTSGETTDPRNSQNNLYLIY